MRVLFFDSTNLWILVEAFEIKTEVEEVYSFSGVFPKESSNRLVSDINNCLEYTSWDKPDILLCCNGPGSFSGIRICVATAKSLSQIWKIPVFTIDSIDLYSSYYYFLEKTKVTVSICGNKNTKKSYIGTFDKKKFFGSFELNIEEVEKNQILYTDSLDFLSGKLIQNHLPKSIFWIENNIQKVYNLDYERFNYHTIYPNYIRLSYFEK